jgi:hypothetical protein
VSLLEDLRLGSSERNPLRSLFPQKTTTRPGAHTSSSNAAGAYLAVAAPGLGHRGVLMGKDLYSGSAFHFDTFELYAAKVLSSPHVIVNGMSGEGKSSGVKSHCTRQLTFRNRQAVVLDAQGDGGTGEWTDIAEAMGITPVRLTPGQEGGVRINPLDPVIKPHRQKALLRALLQIGLARPLALGDGFVLDHALDTARADAGDRVITLVDVLDKLTGPIEPARNSNRQYPVDELAVMGESLALALNELVSGPMRHSFDGPTSESIDLDARLVIFDLSSLDRTSIAVPVVLAVVGEWLDHAWIRPDGVKRTLYLEEAWDYLQHEAVAALAKAWLKYGRRRGLSVWFVMHHPGDVSHSPAAAEVLKMAETRIVYKLRPEEAQLAGKRLQLPAWAVALVSSRQMKQGYAVWAVGQRTFFVQHVRSQLEKQIASTDKGMTA